MSKSKNPIIFRARPRTFEDALYPELEPLRQEVDQVDEKIHDLYEIAHTEYQNVGRGAVGVGVSSLVVVGGAVIEAAPEAIIVGGGIIGMVASLCYSGVKEWRSRSAYNTINTENEKIASYQRINKGIKLILGERHTVDDIPTYF